MKNSLNRFHPLLQDWFTKRFQGPTDAQANGWDAIGQGRHTLIAAPTGSGKTLAAFLTCLDMIIRQGIEGTLPDSTQIVYVSPLKALSNDIYLNLERPLAEIKSLADERDIQFPDIRVAVRTGDTSARDRAAAAKHPPHILITTPESLYILLTSERGRRALKGTHTLILDELHALVGNKRGAHLSLSAERLVRLSENTVTRIGLSATQRPIEEVAKFLVGDAGPTSYKQCAIIDAGHSRAMDINIEMPNGFPLGPIASNEQWSQVLDQVVSQINSHRSTLLFVNTRRLVERVAHLLSERIGDEQVVAHHGSLSVETRLEAETRLRNGSAKVCVATASLELGIDVGDVELVCQIGSPRSINIALQRIGRSGHFLEGTPKGRLYPLTRDELVETAALLRAIKLGKLDSLSIPRWPLDILAQQIVAACVSEDWDEDAMYRLMTGAYPYAELPREKYEEVLKMLSEGVANRWGRSSALLHRDAINRRLKARRGARITAITGGGAIPDTADYSVITESDGVFVGTLNEDFAIESMAGDVFLLGNTPWKILRVESNSVRVESAIGQAPTIPFWLGEAPGRTQELSLGVSELREAIDERLPNLEEITQWIEVNCGVDETVSVQLAEYFSEGKAILGVIPTATRLVAERFFDETGGMQLVIHAPLGTRINRAWGLALRKRFCRMFDFELQASATDDGINLALGPQHSFPLEETFRYLNSSSVDSVLLQAILAAPLFKTRWRWNATRSLSLLRQISGKRVPANLLRMRAEDLLVAVFPEQAACQDNQPASLYINPPDHPLVFETIRDCLTEALDAEGLKQILVSIEQGDIEIQGKDTLQPSAFSHQILNAMPYAFLDDAPLEERRARAVTLRRALPTSTSDLSFLDQSAIRYEVASAWPTVRDSDELHDAMLQFALLTEQEVRARAADFPSWVNWFNQLVRDGRAKRIYVNPHSEAENFWIATERASLIKAVYSQARFDPELPDFTLIENEENALIELVRGRIGCLGPFTVKEMANALCLPSQRVNSAVLALEHEGLLLRGNFRSETLYEEGEEEFCDRRILARIHRSTINMLRGEIAPVPVETFIQFLQEWQHVAPGTQLVGESGLAEVIEQLQGFEAAAVSWEENILPQRIEGYTGGMLDRLCLTGEVVWGRFNRRENVVSGLARHGPISLTLREDLHIWLDPPTVGEDFKKMKGAPAEVYQYLIDRGASFVPDIALETRRLPYEVEDALWQLVAAGLVTSDGFDALRGLATGIRKRAQKASRFRKRPRRPTFSNRWAILRSGYLGDEVIEARAAQLLKRYGIVFYELLTREAMNDNWKSLAQTFRSAEMRGEIRGGRFIKGFSGEQYALPEAVDALRRIRKRSTSELEIEISACDPLNLVGILTSGPRVTAVPGNIVTYKAGEPVFRAIAGAHGSSL